MEQLLPTKLRESSLPSVFCTNFLKNTFCQTIHDVLMISVVSSPPVKSATNVLISLFAHFTSFVVSHFNTSYNKSMFACLKFCNHSHFYCDGLN